MKAGFANHLAGVCWLLPKQVRGFLRENWFLLFPGMLLGVVLIGVLMTKVVDLEQSLEERGTPAASRFSHTPAGMFLESEFARKWLGQDEERGLPLEGVGVWVDCTGASEEQCQEGVKVVQATGAVLMDEDEAPHIDLSWNGQGWEVGSRQDIQYVAIAAVVLHAQAQNGSWQYLFRPDFTLVEGEVPSEEERLQDLLSSFSWALVVVGLLFPSALVSSSTSALMLGRFMLEVEDGRFEPMIGVLFPPWVLFLAKAAAAGVVVGFTVGAMAALMRLVLLPIPVLAVVALALSMGLITFATVMWGFLLIPLQSFLGRYPVVKMLRSLPNPAAIVPFLFVYGMLIVSALDFSGPLGASTLAQATSLPTPLVNWGTWQALAVGSAGIVYAALSLAVFLLVHHSPWGRRRIAFRAPGA